MPRNTRDLTASEARNRQLDRDANVRTGWYALVASVVIAAGAIGGSLVGSYVTANAVGRTLDATHTEAADDRKAALASYEREQRRKAYVQLVTTNRKIADAEQDILAPAYQDALPDPKKAPGVATATRREFRVAADVVRVVSQDAEISQIVDDFIHYHQVAKRQIRAVLDGKPAGGVNNLCVTNTILDLSGKLARYLSTVEKVGVYTSDNGQTSKKVTNPKPGAHIAFTACGLATADEEAIEP